MFEGQVEELAHHAGQRAVGAAGHQRARRGQRPRVAGKHAGGAAPRVARELVEHDHFGQRRARLRGPAGEFTAQRGVDQWTKALADRRVEGVVLAEPLGPRLQVVGLVGAAEPEVQHLGGARVDVGLVHSSRSCVSGWRRM